MYYWISDKLYFAWNFNRIICVTGSSELGIVMFLLASAFLHILCLWVTFELERHLHTHIHNKKIEKFLKFLKKR